MSLYAIIWKNEATCRLSALEIFCSIGYYLNVFRCGATVARLAVNEKVVGSSPTIGALRQAQGKSCNQIVHEKREKSRFFVDS